MKNVLDGQHLREVNPLFLRIAHERGFYSEDLMDEVAKTGSCQGIDEVPDDVKRLFKTAMEIDYRAHVRMQRHSRRHTDLAVSKTINMRNEAKVEDVAQAYWMAYENGCKGITVYRDGSKPVQVLEVQRTRGEEDAGEDEIELIKAPRPVAMQGVTERLRTGHGNTYITINLDESRRPFEVFTNLGKAGRMRLSEHGGG